MNSDCRFSLNFFLPHLCTDRHNLNKNSAVFFLESHHLFKLRIVCDILFPLRSDSLSFTLWLIWSLWIDICSSAYPPVRGQSHGIQNFITRSHPTEWNSYDTGISPSFPSFRSGIQHSIFHLKALCRKCSLPVVTSKTCLGATSPHSLRAYFLES